MEIKILVKEDQEQELQNFIKTCEANGFKLTREGGGNLPNFSGYFAELQGEKWQETSDKPALTIPIASFSEERSDVLNGCNYRVQGACQFMGNCMVDTCDLRGPFKA